MYLSVVREKYSRKKKEKEKVSALITVIGNTDHVRNIGEYGVGKVGSCRRPAPSASQARGGAVGFHT